MLSSPSLTNRGFSLIEVLVALLILSIGLLGLAMLQVEGLKLNSDAYLRTQATVMAYDIIDRMRANKVGSDTGQYCLNGPGTTGTPTCTNAAPATQTTCGDSATGCGTTAEMASYDLTQWYAEMRRKLPLSTANLPEIQRRQTLVGAGGSAATVQVYTVLMRWIEHDLLIEQKWEVEI